MLLDIAVLGIITFLAWQGAARGFVQSVLGPVAFILASAAALVYFGITQNLWIALLIGLFGPFLLHWFLAFAVRTFGKVAGGNGNPSIISSLLGAVLTMAWGLLFILPVMIGLVLIPPTLPGYAPVHKYLMGTKTFIATQYLLQTAHITPPAAAAPKAEGPASETGRAPAAIQSIADDRRLKQLMNEPDIAKAVKDNNIAALMSNPKFLKLVQQLAQDPEFMKKALSAYSQMPAPIQSKNKN